jgi:hypothetical protein
MAYPEDERDETSDVTTPLYYEVPMVDPYENDITMVDVRI